MRLSSAIYVFVLALAAEGSSAPAPRRTYCGGHGEGCWKLGRAVEVAARAMSESGPNITSETIACYAPGAPCNLAKREALELAQAVAEAHNIAAVDDSETHSSAGKPPRSRVERQLTSTLGSDDESDNDIEKREPRRKWCGSALEGCSGIKRDANQEVAEILKTAPEEPSSESEATEKRSCYEDGGACTGAKRATDFLEARMMA